MTQSASLPGPPWLAGWCQEHLGATPVSSLLRVEQMSEVLGLRLADGREIVVKARADPAGRVPTCGVAQHYLADRGFPCAEPLTPATRVGDLAVHAERWRPGGEMLRGDSPVVAGHFARLLAVLAADLSAIDLDALHVVPPLPNPMWVEWDHPGGGIWPASFLDERDQSLVPAFVRETALRATARLRAAADLPRVIGHADWETQNLRWLDVATDPRPWAVHDWDSLAWLPEAACVGAACGAFASAEVPTLTPIAASQAFLDAYQQERGRTFSTDEVEVAWAASLWPAAHNARAQTLFEQPPVAVAALAAQAVERLRRAGA